MLSECCKTLQFPNPHWTRGSKLKNCYKVAETLQSIKALVHSVLELF
jgi:hypothetical protein